MSIEKLCNELFPPQCCLRPLIAIPGGPCSMLADSELMARVCEHDVSAFETLSARYWESIYRHVLATIHDSSATEDIVQEVFLRIWTRAEQWHGRGSFKAWLFR